MEFSFIWVFHLNATDLMLASEQITGTFPLRNPAISFARQPSPSDTACLYCLREGMTPMIRPLRSGPPAIRIVSRVYPIMNPMACLGCIPLGRVTM